MVGSSSICCHSGYSGAAQTGHVQPRRLGGVDARGHSIPTVAHEVVASLSGDAAPEEDGSTA